MSADHVVASLERQIDNAMSSAEYLDIIAADATGLCREFREHKQKWSDAAILLSAIHIELGGDGEWQGADLLALVREAKAAFPYAERLLPLARAWRDHLESEAGNFLRYSVEDRAVIAEQLKLVDAALATNPEPEWAASNRTVYAQPDTVLTVLRSDTDRLNWLEAHEGHVEPTTWNADIPPNYPEVPGWWVNGQEREKLREAVDAAIDAACVLTERMEKP